MNTLKNTGDNTRLVKLCKYMCGKFVYWDVQQPTKLKWVEADTGLLHDYRRCGDLLNMQGKKLKKENDKGVINPPPTDEVSPKGPYDALHNVNELKDSMKKIPRHYAPGKPS